MTAKKNLKRRVRARAAKTGESYTTALRHLRPAPAGKAMPECAQNALRIAVAQTAVREDPTDVLALRESGDEIRRSMRAAANTGARLVHFTEGAICFPSKRVMSSLGACEIGPSDWSKAQWAVLADAIDRIAALSRELRIWTVVPCVHRLPAPSRPHNSIYVVSDEGELITRYDERMLSTTKITWMYTPGEQPVTFEVDGYRFGLSLGLDVLFPELFTQYDQLGVDAVLVSYATTGSNTETVPILARGYAAINTYWISLAVPVNPTCNVVSGVIEPTGNWAAECSPGSTTLALADVRRVEVSQIGREFRRRTRARAGG